MEKKHKSGFVNIIGSPNVGKSTLMNRLVGEKLSIITSKKQTTRHRIMGIVSGDDFQIVYSDTPGVLDAKYKLHEGMMGFVESALQDADIILVVTDLFEDTMEHQETLEKIKKMSIPKFVLINKIDLAKSEEQITDKVTIWANHLPDAQILPISALYKANLEFVINKIKELLPESPAYFSKDEFTDRSMRFLVSEMIREKIFLRYRKEIPYSCEVVVEEYRENDDIVRIRANVIVSRDSQKNIIIGSQGSGIKNVGIDSRKDIEAFVGKKVFLDLFVKVDKDWRQNEKKLKRYGYMQ